MKYYEYSIQRLLLFDVTTGNKPFFYTNGVNRGYLYSGVIDLHVTGKMWYVGLRKRDLKLV